MDEKYQKALDVLHERLPMQLQRQEETGEWKNVGSCVRGKEEGYKKLHALKAKNQKANLRVIPKNEADKYREGLTIGLKLGSSKSTGDERTDARLLDYPLEPAES